MIDLASHPENQSPDKRSVMQLFGGALPKECIYRIDKDGSIIEMPYHEETSVHFHDRPSRPVLLDGSGESVDPLSCDHITSAEVRKAFFSTPGRTYFYYLAVHPSFAYGTDLHLVLANYLNSNSLSQHNG